MDESAKLKKSLKQFEKKIKETYQKLSKETPVLFLGLGVFITEKTKKGTKYLRAKSRRGKKQILKLPKKIKESDQVIYWKDFIKGIPEYHALVKAKKWDEIENIIKTLDLHDEALRALNTAIMDLKVENVMENLDIQAEALRTSITAIMELKIENIMEALNLHDEALRTLNKSIMDLKNETKEEKR